MTTQIIKTKNGGRLPLSEVTFLKDGVIFHDVFNDFIHESDYTIEDVVVPYIDMTIEECEQQEKEELENRRKAELEAHKTFKLFKPIFDYSRLTKAMSKIDPKSEGGIETLLLLESIRNKPKSELTYKELDIYGYKTSDYLDFVDLQNQYDQKKKDHFKKVFAKYNVTY